MEREPCPSCVASRLRGCGHCGWTGFKETRTYIPGQRRSDGDGYTAAIAKASSDIDDRDARRAARLRSSAEADPMRVIAKAYGIDEPLAKALSARESAASELAQMAEEVQRASGFSVSEAQATTRVLTTARGRALYRAYDEASFAAVRLMDGA